MFKLFREINKTIKENGSHDSAVMKEDFDFEYMMIEFSMNGYNIIISKDDNEELYSISLHNEIKLYSNYIKDIEEKDVINRISEIIK
jgi:hypothetical protein